MASLKDQLTTVFRQTFASLGYDSSWGDVIVSNRPDLAQYQCNGSLGLAKSQSKNPRELATSVIAVAQGLAETAFGPQSVSLSIAGPGFINIVLSDELLARVTNAAAHDDRLGIDKVAQPRTVVIDYGGPNVAKAMHVGHLRSTVIGESLCRIFRFMGEKVIGDDHLGDWGTPMGMILGELKRRRPDMPYFDPDL